MGYKTKCRRCYGTGRTTRWNDASKRYRDEPCAHCRGTGAEKKYRVALTVCEAQGLGWSELRAQQPRFGTAGHCQVCDGKLAGRRTTFCSDRCRRRFYERIYGGAHWQKRLVAWRDGWACKHCGELMESPLLEIGVIPLPDFSRLQLDHKRALHLGGDESPDNCQLLCDACHTRKTAIERREGWMAASKSPAGLFG